MPHTNKLPMISRTNSNFRNRLCLIVFRSDTPPGRIFDTILLWMILLTILAVILESMSSFRRDYIDLIRAAEWFFAVLFTIEYILRVYAVINPGNIFLVFMDLLICSLSFQPISVY